MPKLVNHDERRRELAEAACVLIGRHGVDGVSLRALGVEAGWSVGSMRHYFTTKAELLDFVLTWLGERVESRIADTSAADRTAVSSLRGAVLELLPLDPARRQEALVWLAFVGQAAVDPGLRPTAERVWRSIRLPLVGRLHTAVERGEVRADLDVERQATTLHSILDGLTLALLTTEGLIDPDQAAAVIDSFLTGLGPGSDEA